MRIGELARRSGVSVSRIRFYEGRGLLPSAPRQDNGYRSYGEEAVALLYFVNQAQRLGFSLAEIRGATLAPGAAKPSPAIMIEALRRKEAEIDRLIDAATSKKHAIAVLLDELQCAA